MASVNKVILIGNLGQDPESRSTNSGTRVVTLRIATTEVIGSGESRKEITEWHRVVVWGSTAEHCAQYLKKGRSVYVEGRLQTRSYEDKEGQKRYSTEVVAQTVKFLGGPAGERQGGDGGFGERRPKATESAGSEAPTPFDEPKAPEEDDFPF